MYLHCRSLYIYKNQPTFFGIIFLICIQLSYLDQGICRISALLRHSSALCTPLHSVNNSAQREQMKRPTVFAVVFFRYNIPVFRLDPNKTTETNGGFLRQILCTQLRIYDENMLFRVSDFLLKIKAFSKPGTVIYKKNYT